MENNIELRSPKVKNIIGQVPNKIIRIGISLIFVLIIGILSASYLIKYNYIVIAKTIIEQKNDTTFFSLLVPVNKINYIKSGQTIIISLDNIKNIYDRQIKLKLKSKNITKQIFIENQQAFYTLNFSSVEDLKTNNGEVIKILNKTEFKTKIIAKKMSFLQRILIEN